MRVRGAPEQEAIDPGPPRLFWKLTEKRRHDGASLAIPLRFIVPAGGKPEAPPIVGMRRSGWRTTGSRGSAAGASIFSSVEDVVIERSPVVGQWPASASASAKVRIGGRPTEVRPFRSYPSRLEGLSYAASQKGGRPRISET